jgi:hypothetical protein
MEKQIILTKNLATFGEAKNLARTENK